VSLLVPWFGATRSKRVRVSVCESNYSQVELCSNDGTRADNGALIDARIRRNRADDYHCAPRDVRNSVRQFVTIIGRNGKYNWIRLEQTGANRDELFVLPLALFNRYVSREALDTNRRRIEGLSLFNSAR